jgi:inorganic pyrophosphatase
MADYGTNSKGFKLQGKTSVQGLKVAIENRRGSVREGKNEDGSKWRTKYKIPYGYIEGTKGADGEEVDAYVGPDKEAPKAYVVKQKKDDGSYDEDTVMLGFKSKAKARKAILQHYDDPKYIGATKAVPMEKLKQELKKTAEKKAKEKPKPKAKPKSKEPTRYEQMRAAAPVQVIEGDEKHPFTPMGGAYFPSGAGRLLRSAYPDLELPEKPFIFSGGPDRRVQMKGLMTGNIDASPEAVLAHEIGHAKDQMEGGFSGKVLQSPTVRGLGQTGGMGAGMLGGMLVGKALEDKPHIGIPASMAVGAIGAGLGHVPTLMSESRATKGGLGQLGTAGASEEELAQYKKELASAYGSYKRGALASAILSGAAAPILAKTSEAKPGGFYKGQPMSPHTVKFKMEYQGIPINVDRPKGFIMKGKDAKGNDWARRYRYNYGFIPKTLGGDGDGLDVFVGPDKKAKYAFWAMQRNDEGAFDEYKVFLGFPDRDAAVAVYRQHIPKKYFQGIVTMKVEMMKAMLGKVNPDEKIKRASVVAMLDELGWLMRTSA